MLSRWFLNTALLLVAIHAGSAQAVAWKAAFIAGDDSIANFDNGRIDLTKVFASKGQIEAFQFSSSREHISAQQNVYPATGEILQNFFSQLNVAEGEDQGCFIHMTSHGAKGQGFYLALSGILPPDLFSEWVNLACGSAPTVILISACYSGQFITQSLKGPNRIILTAARSDRPSFGCSPDTRYTYWDSCLLDEVPHSKTWVELYAKANSCITRKESQVGVQPSEPQAYFGANTGEWQILH